jgi:hypothetical protein
VVISLGVFLVVASLIGGIDVLYFHLYRFRLCTRPSSRSETLAHLAQSWTFIPICLFAAVAPHRSSAIAALFLLHFASAAMDILLERTSRLALDGLPPVEVLLHVAGAVATGGAFAVLLVVPPAPPEPWLRPCLLAAVVAGTAVSAAELFFLVKGCLPSDARVHNSVGGAGLDSKFEHDSNLKSGEVPVSGRVSAPSGSPLPSDGLQLRARRDSGERP